MNAITVKRAIAHNLKEVSVRIPLGKLVVIVGKSGSGKSSFVHDILYRASQGNSVDAYVGRMPPTFVLEQGGIASGTLGWSEARFQKMKEMIAHIKAGSLFIVDEPCAGMAKEDRALVIKTLRQAVEKGISIIAVEHDSDLITHADEIIEFGPESGVNGGRVIFQGSVSAYKKSYVFPSSEWMEKNTKQKPGKILTIKGITKHALHDFVMSFPLERLVCVSGRMGTGKSTLLSVVYGALFKGRDAWKWREAFDSVEGKVNVRRSYFVDQSTLSPIVTSTPATYIGVWRMIKKAGGTERMTVDEAAGMFKDIPLIARKLGFLQEVGLGYLSLSQRSGTLSGGEAQRVRLAKILSKKLGDRCVYVLDTPSRGLYPSDFPMLVRVLRRIVEKKNTVLIAENREEIIHVCDHCIRL